MATIATPPASEQDEQPSTRRTVITVVGLAVGLTVAVAIMLLAFALPAVNSGAKDLPVAVSGPAPAVAKLSQGLSSQGDAINVHIEPAASDVRDAVQQRDAIGGIVVGQDGTVVQTASAAGAPYSEVMKGIGSKLSGQGQKVSYQDLAPFTKDDPSGSGLSVLGLPLAFGGMISAVTMSTLLKGRPRAKLIGSLLFSALAGLLVSTILQFWLGTVDGPFLQVAGSLAMGIAAISMTVLGFEALLGYPGLAIGALLMMFVSNPLSGLTTGPDWLPSPWGDIGQFLPIGAAGYLTRSVAFFDGGGTRAALVLLVWMLLGSFLLGISARRVRHERRRQGRHAEVAAAS